MRTVYHSLKIRAYCTVLAYRVVTYCHPCSSLYQKNQVWRLRRWSFS